MDHLLTILHAFIAGVIVTVEVAGWFRDRGD